MNEQNIETKMKNWVVSRSRKVLQDTARVDEEGKGTEKDIEDLLVARVRATDPPKAKDTEDESGQDGQLP